MNASTRDVFTIMKPDLERVEDVLVTAASIDYPIVNTMLHAIVSGGGKRLRPVLLLLAAKAFGTFNERAVDVAAGVELLHTASLVHDDSIDKAALRRGNPTLNTELSTGAVILIGDYLFAQSAILAARPENPRVMVIFATTLAEICDGQIRETLEAHRLDQSMAEYEVRIFGKTAALFAGAAEMGAVLGGGSDEQVANLRQIGTDLGMAFQVIDDVLDLRESSETIGKPAGNDLRQGVVTVPVMSFIANLPADAPQRALIERIVAGDETNDQTIDALVQEIRNSGALVEAERIAQGYVASARARVELVPDEDTRDSLNQLLDLATIRSV
ncbi:MAG: polyprenyl synthetase family protein [Thermomicrobiales bacterium]|nr:polyprenyl synthetase family protein [Thermomicrobiales bacterium]MCO5219869.1 polyprenyl synthetase family protein [Thermomicrobiales bacterium]MCO5226397.1 polyprenyl synthetase family protein [Thermomicrobiales bacterium]MCO5229427.1 polyprenyl synthetase family protein [Thermomicrobiales bacterium]